MEKIEVFICAKCGYEDSSFIPMKKDLSLSECPNCNKEVKVNIVEVEKGKNMSIAEYLELVKYIHEHHSFAKAKGKRIKYISNTLDFRTGNIYRIVLNDKEFAKVNQNRHRDLKEWIYGYLNN